jgi:PIN domain nuclease of toxin-antitoxin system
MIENGYEELPILSQHILGVDALPPIHNDPFDRLLIAQAIVERTTFLTVDATIARYPGPIRKV